MLGSSACARNWQLDSGDGNDPAAWVVVGQFDDPAGDGGFLNCAEEAWLRLGLGRDEGSREVHRERWALRAMALCRN